MERYQQLMKRHSKYILYLLAIFVVGWGFTPYQSIYLGLILGVSVSWFNLWTMHRKIDSFGRAVIAGKKVKSLGMLLRMGTAAFSAFIVFRYPDLFQLGYLIIGLMTPYLVIMIDMFFNVLILRKRGE